MNAAMDTKNKKTPMKGSSLPMETIVIVIISVVVLAALIFFFFNIYTPGSGAIQAQVTISSVCGDYAAKVQCKDPADFYVYGVTGDRDKNKDIQNAQIDKMNELARACYTAGVPTCQGEGEKANGPSTACIQICCQSFCPKQ